MHWYTDVSFKVRSKGQHVHGVKASLARLPLSHLALNVAQVAAARTCAYDGWWSCPSSSSRSMCSQGSSTSGSAGAGSSSAMTARTLGMTSKSSAAVPKQCQRRRGVCQRAYLTFALRDFGRFDEDPECYRRRCASVHVISGVHVDLSLRRAELALVLAGLRLLHAQRGDLAREARVGGLRGGAPLALLAVRGLLGALAVVREVADGLQDGGGRHVGVEGVGARGSGRLRALAPGLERARGYDVGGADGHELVDVASDEGSCGRHPGVYGV